MNYTQARTQLRQWTVQAVKPGLDRTCRLLEALGRPDTGIPAIQITGTNGKGSVAALLASALLAAGHKTGRFTSPHLRDERERIAINGVPVSRPVFVAGVKRLLPQLKKLHAQKNPATTFEAWTVLAALVFQRAGVRVAVLEVGMGGRLDSTSAWGNVKASVLTHVSLEHTRELGNTLQSIAREKAAIARREVPFFTAESNPAIYALLSAHCRKQHAPFHGAGFDPGRESRILAWTRKPRGIALDLALGSEKISGLQVGLRGEHQVLNAALAALVLRHLDQAGLGAGLTGLRRGFQAVAWPGRLEKFTGPPKVFLDGAHNPDAAEGLARELKAGIGPVYLVMGAMEDKDVRAMVRILAPFALKAWAVKPPDKRGLSAQSLADLFLHAGVAALAEPSLGSALGKALKSAGARGTVLVTGSLYLMGPARRYLDRKGII